MRATAMFGGLIVGALLLGSCGGSHNFRVISPAEGPSTPPYLELRSAPSASTLHFPRGTYVLNAVDDKGYYYRAPQRIRQHSFSSGRSYDGGIFVEKRDPRRLRGYVIMPGGLTHVGNFSRADYEFRYGSNRSIPQSPAPEPTSEEPL
jgi:hypothetical protein